MSIPEFSPIALIVLSIITILFLVTVGLTIKRYRKAKKEFATGVRDKKPSFASDGYLELTLVLTAALLGAVPAAYGTFPAVAGTF